MGAGGLKSLSTKFPLLVVADHINKCSFNRELEQIQNKSIIHFFAIFCIVKRYIVSNYSHTRGGEGGKKTVPLECFWEEYLYLRNFPYFRAKIDHFLNFSKNYRLKMQ